MACRRRRDHRDRHDGRPAGGPDGERLVKGRDHGGRATVEKIIGLSRTIPVADPMVYLVDSAGARITDR